MKVLQVNVTKGKGSTGRIAENISQMVIDQGGEACIAYGREEAIGEVPAYRIGNEISVYKHVLKTRLFDAHGLGSRHATKVFIEWVQRYAPDIIHLHNIHGYYLHYPTLFKFLKDYGRPVVWTLHDCWPFTGHCSHFEAIGCDRWQFGCHCCPIKSHYPSSWLCDRSSSNYEKKKLFFRSLNSHLTIVPVSHWLEDLLSQSFLSEMTMQVIHNGINLFDFQPQEDIALQYTSQLQKKCYLSVGSKGLSDIIEFSKQYLRDDEIILVVGLTESEIKKWSSNKVIALPRTESIKEMSELYSFCDAYLNFTYGDTYPTTNLESIASGTPVVAYRTGGSPEAITKETGFVVDKRDFIEVRKALDQIKYLGKKRYRENCVNYARKHFDQNIQLKEYEKLYERLYL